MPPPLTRQRAKELFYEVVAEHLGTLDGNLTDETSWRDLGADSLDAVEIIMGVEDGFEIEVGEEDENLLAEIFKGGTVGKAWEWLAARPELATSFREETRP